MRREVPFGSWSLAAAGITVLAAKAFHSVALVPIWAGQTAAWLAVLLAGLLALALYWPVAAAVAALPRGNLITLAQVALGRPGAVTTGILLTGILISQSSLVLRETVEMTASAVYPHTPATFAIATLAACVFYSAFGGLGSLVRLCRVLMPLLLLAILLILMLVFGWGEVRYLLPFWGPGPGVLATRSAALTGIYTPVLFLLLAAGRVRDRRRLPRAAAMVIATSALVFAAILAVFLMTHPYPLGRNVPFPLHDLSRLVMGGRFFERIEGMWILFWLMATAAHLGVVVHVAALAWADGFGLQNHRTAVPGLMTITLTLALFPPDQAETIAWHGAAVRWATAIAFGLPLALALLAAWRGRFHGRAA